jgi:hypothetical protein
LPVVVTENVNDTVPEVTAALVSVNDVLLTTDATVSEAGIPVPLTFIPWAIPVVDATRTVVVLAVAPDSLKPIDRLFVPLNHVVVAALSTSVLPDSEATVVDVGIPAPLIESPI